MVPTASTRTQAEAQQRVTNVQFAGGTGQTFPASAQAPSQTTGPNAPGSVGDDGLPPVPASATASAAAPLVAAPASAPWEKSPTVAQAPMLTKTTAEQASEQASAATRVEASSPSTSVMMSRALAAFVVLAALLGGAWLWHSWRRDGRRQVAAALQGELMAARAIILTRIDMMADAKAVPQWPRLRVMVFQAYVGQMDKLGPDLSRRLAALYGQFADFAAYYGTSQATESRRVDAASLRAVLVQMMHYLDQVVLELQDIAATGLAQRYRPQPSTYPAPSSAPAYGADANADNAGDDSVIDFAQAARPRQS
ncbi:MAG: hypothetical protein EBZ69_08445 [Alphaproteobacteria bacterium]|nr:hypothetical protein [Alphaproteobacteria bacterium]